MVMVGDEVPEVALHHMQRDAGVQQAGGPGVAETVGAVEVDQGAGAVAHVQPDGPDRSSRFRRVLPE